ncbi:hypothetical protein [Streptomyces virginiae]|uniref:hypothetical protein n=1 Tax=Streptomyces virginiae TaxID=1961 RepID=UPI00362996DD
MTDPIFITDQDISIPPNNATLLKSPQLLNSLLKDQDAALAFLAEQAAPVRLDEISVDNLGNVVIANEEFTNALNLKLNGTQEEARKVKNKLCGLMC